MVIKRYVVVVIATLMVALGIVDGARAAQHDDRDALKGIRTGKAIFDVNTGEPDKLVLYLDVIKETIQGLRKQKVRPDVIIAFRGVSVRLITTSQEDAEQGKREVFEKIRKLIAELKALGVKLEACSIATRLFEVENNTVLPEIKVVGNTFISLIGYQSMGYAVIPIM
ncbi:MAG: DsrE family protein [Nitrospirota bacterium]